MRHGHAAAFPTRRSSALSRLAAVLRLSGITRAVGGALQVRNRIYERVFDRAWVTQHMPGRTPAHRSGCGPARSEEHTSELQSIRHLVFRILFEKKKEKVN